MSTSFIERKISRQTDWFKTVFLAQLSPNFISSNKNSITKVKDSQRHLSRPCNQLVYKWWNKFCKCCSQMQILTEIVMIGSLLASPYTASLQALSVNAFRWRIRDERPGDASKTFSDHVIRNGSAAHNNEAQGLGKEMMTLFRRGQVWEWVWILDAGSEIGSGFGEPGGTPHQKLRGVPTLD